MVQLWRQMKMNQTITILSTLVISVVSLGGCTDPRAEAPTRTRLDRINRYGRMVRDRENEGPRRLAASADLIERQSRQHDAYLRRDLKRLKDWSRRDIQRWHERQARYRADLEDLWDGNLELADETIPHMFY